MMSIDWRRAYFQQAYSDFEIAKLLLTETAAGRVHRCHVLHYLQMTLEKVGKGFRILPGGKDLSHSHKGATQLLRLLMQGNSHNRPFHHILRMTQTQIVEYLQGLLPTVEAIERLAPALTQNGINAEYPWQASSKLGVIAPTKYSFNSPDLQEPNILKVKQLLQIIFDVLHSRKEF